MTMAPSTAGRRRTTRARRRRLRFRLSRALFVLPNLFTCASIFCGFYAILLAQAPTSPAGLYRASVVICFAIFFDMADGRVARLTSTQSEFGVQLDSLADIISFGVAPAVLAYRWSLVRLGPAGVFVAFFYIACGALRLARFNVLAARERPAMPINAEQHHLPFRESHARVESPHRFFLGLPIPLSAGVIAAAVMSAQRSQAFASLHRFLAAAVVLLLGLLMVSNVRYRTFKELRPSRESISLALGVLTVFFAVARLLTPAFGGLLLFSTYVALGLLEAALAWLRRP